METRFGTKDWLERVDELRLSETSRETIKLIERPLRDGLGPGELARQLGLSRHQLRHRRERLRREAARQLSPARPRRCIWCSRPLQSGQRIDVIFCHNPSRPRSSPCRTRFHRASRQALITGALNAELLLALHRYPETDWKHTYVAELQLRQLGLRNP